MSTALYKALRVADVPDDLAERAAESIPVEAATRTDLADLKADLAALEVRMLRTNIALAIVVIAAVGALQKLL